jgi:CRP-like cAMP-binding protein
VSTVQSENLYKKGQTIFYEGNPALGVYCVATGNIKLYKTSAQGRPQILGIVGAGTILGHRSLLTNRPHGLTAEALEDSRVCFFERGFFLNLLKREASVANEVIKRLSQDLDAVEDRLMDLVEKPVPARLARLLLMLKEVHGQSVPQGVALRLLLTREEMAEMIGTTQETTIRLLSRFREQKFIRLDKKNHRLNGHRRIGQRGRIVLVVP